jgi:glycerol-3-phosphate dehydrogenase
MQEGRFAMNRDQMLSRLADDDQPWDVLIIGGGATGLGCAIDAAARGYRTVLLERADFAQATTSRSTKLVHGGVRYLPQGNLTLVRDALAERGLLLANAPHLCRAQQFIVPCYGHLSRWYYGLGLKVYDWLSGRLSLGPTRLLGRREVTGALGAIAGDRLVGGVSYFDGQFDDARLAISLAQTAADQGALLLNYTPVTELITERGRVTGAIAVDQETGRTCRIAASVVINATGVFADEIRRMAQPQAEPVIQPSRGTHLVINRSDMAGDAALMIPKTDDGRVLFTIPWYQRLVVGTTDVPVDQPSGQPRASAEEIDFLLDHTGRYCGRRIERSDVCSVFSGLRPLVCSGDSGRRTSAISRDHVVSVSEQGLVNVLGGKWTTYRRMASDAIDAAAKVAGLAERACVTRNLAIHGAGVDREASSSWSSPADAYGTDRTAVEALAEAEPNLDQPLHGRLDYRWVDVAWSVRHEMARTVEDVLARRTRALVLDAAAARAVGPVVAEFLAGELKRDATWAKQQARAFDALARSCQLD